MRPYKKIDAPKMRQLYEEFVAYHSQFDPSFLKIENHGEQFVEYANSFLGCTDKFCIVAELETKVVGYCLSLIEQKPPVYPNPKFGYIDNLCVSSKFQRRGIGAALFDDAVKRFRSLDINRVECYVAMENPKSTAFWQKMHFKPFMAHMYLSLEDRHGE